MISYIAETPGAMLSQLSNFRDLTKGVSNLLRQNKPRILYLIASGSSFNAACCAAPFMRNLLQCEIIPIMPYSFTNRRKCLKNDELSIVISQSGYSSSSINALRCVAQNGRDAIALTCDMHSDIVKAADYVFDVGCGEESAGYVTKSVTGIALFLMLSALNTTGSEKPPSDFHFAIEGNQVCIQKAQCFWQDHCEEMTSLTEVMLCGCSAGLGTAQEGALKLSETVQIPAFAYETEEFLHGPNLRLTPLSTVFLIDDDATQIRPREIFSALAAVTQHGFLITLTDLPETHNIFSIPYAVNPDLSPLVMLPLFQTLAYQITEAKHLWYKHPLLKGFEEKISGKTENYIQRERL